MAQERSERDEGSAGGSVPATVEPASSMTTVEPTASFAAAGAAGSGEQDATLEEEDILEADEGAPLSNEDLAGRGFTSSVAYRDEPADCVLITCSDQRFRLQTLELVRHLGYARPHIIQIPGGLVVSLPLLAAFGFLSKAVDRIVEKALEATGVEDVICIAHEDCAGYKAENVRFLDAAVRKVTGGSIRDTQISHLRKAARRLQLGLRGMTVRAFFADVSDTPSPQVTFQEVDITHR